MIKNKFVKVIALGFLTWLAPFVFSFFFYNREGKLTISYDLFKSIMIVVSSLVSSYALLRYYKSIKNDFAREGLVTAVVWFVINLVLDLLILIPMSGMSLENYFYSIGIRYLQIPVICITAGLLQQRQLKL